MQRPVERAALPPVCKAWSLAPKPLLCTAFSGLLLLVGRCEESSIVVRGFTDYATPSGFGLSYPPANIADKNFGNFAHSSTNNGSDSRFGVELIGEWSTAVAVFI